MSYRAAGYSTVNLIIQGEAGADIQTGVAADFKIDFNGNIFEADLMSHLNAGDLQVTIWKKNAGSGYPPLSGNSIVGATPPTLTAAQYYTDTSLSDWTTDFQSGDIFTVNVESCTGIKLATLALKIRSID